MKKGTDCVRLMLLLHWIASRRNSFGSKRSDHATDLIYFAREVLENVDDVEYWKDELYP